MTTPSLEMELRQSRRWTIGMVMAMEEEPRVVDNPEQSRYELWVGSTRAGLIQYLPEEEDTVLLVHPTMACSEQPS